LSLGRHEWFCLVAAGIVHFSLPVGAAIAPEAQARRWVTVKRAGPSEVHVDLDSAFLPPPRNFRVDQDGVALGMPNADPAAPSNPHFDPTRPATPNRHNPREPSDEEPSEDTVLSGEGPSDNDTFNPDDEFNNPPGVGMPWGTPGLDPGLPIWLYPGSDFSPDADGGGDNPAPTKTKKRKYDADAPTAAVQDEIRKKDAKLGLDFPGRGPIRSAFVSATYSSDSPYDASAVFALSVNPDGKVTSVSYVNHTGGKASTWRRVGRVAHKALKGTKLVMKSAFAKGASVTVIITSKKVSPGGGTSRDGATIHFDTSDIGAKDTRVVSAAVAPSPVK
jgi:hypothetical protein